LILPEIPPSGLDSSRSSIKHLMQVIEAYKKLSWLVTCHGPQRGSNTYWNWIDGPFRNFMANRILTIGKSFLE